MPNENPKEVERTQNDVKSAMFNKSPTRSVKSKSKISVVRSPKNTLQSTDGHEVKKRRKDKSHKKIPLLPIGSKVLGKFELQDVIAAGGYGQIYKAVDTSKTPPHPVAVKVMIRTREPQRMVLEQQILRELRGKKTFPQLHGSGRIKDVMFLVMDLLGKSLSDLRKKAEHRRFDPPTAIRVGMSVTESLRMLHDLGYIHRDVKPGNMCIGRLADDQQTVYVVDFGLSRPYRDRANGNKVIKRSRGGFRGTMRYVSINVHERRDQCTCDDLISLYYSVVELSEGRLPWSRLKEHTDIALKKKTITFKQMCTTQPAVLEDYYTYCYETVEDPMQPHYEELIEILKKCLPEGYDMKNEMVWETPPGTDKESNRKDPSNDTAP